MSPVPQDTGWFKSSRSGGATDNCVEVRMIADEPVGVRDSKNPAAGAFRVSPATWSAFLRTTKRGGFDLPV